MGQKNQRGSALLNAIIVAGLVAGIAGVIMSQTRVTEKESRNPRIKSAMTVLETQMLSMAMQPGLYQGCSSQAQNCKLSETAIQAFKNLNRPIAGANCGSTHGHSSQSSPGGTGLSPNSPVNSSSGCGVSVQAASGLACLNAKNPAYNPNCQAGQFYNPATQTFCAEIVYGGSEVAMQPMCASTTIPQSVLQGSNSSCTSAGNLAGPYPKIIFRGYDGAGNAVCGAIPSCSGGNVGMAGNYITAIDKQTVQTQCKSLGSTTLACPAGTVMAGLNWSTVTSAFSSFSTATNCLARRQPADTHKVQNITAITVPATSYPVGATPTTTTVPVAGPPPTTMPAAHTICCTDGKTAYVKNPAGAGYAGGKIVPSCGGIPACVCDASLSCCVQTNGKALMSLPASCF